MSIVERLRAIPPRSWLFVPALRAPEWIPKAVVAGADAIIVDLEDATAPAELPRARDSVRGLALGRDAPWVFVRVNATDEDLRPDVAAAIASGAHGVMLPKAEGPRDVRRLAELLSDLETAGNEPLAIMVLIERPRAVLSALDIAESDPRVVGLALGAGDLAPRTGFLRSPSGHELTVTRGLLVLAAGAAAVAAVDTPFLEIADTAGLRREAIAIAEAGFSGKLVVHPSHIEVINEAFSPSDQQVRDARGLLEAFETAVASGVGAIRFKGRMIDQPDAAQARRVIARAQHRQSGQ